MAISENKWLNHDLWFLDYIGGITELQNEDIEKEITTGLALKSPSKCLQTHEYVRAHRHQPVYKNAGVSGLLLLQFAYTFHNSPRLEY